MRKPQVKRMERALMLKAVAERVSQQEQQARGKLMPKVLAQHLAYNLMRKEVEQSLLVRSLMQKEKATPHPVKRPTHRVSGTRHQVERHTHRVLVIRLPPKGSLSQEDIQKQVKMVFRQINRIANL